VRQLPIVAIVGRPNVGKSSLFNRLVRKRTAIVEELPGVTRDRIYADVEWQGKIFTLVDTGGLEFLNTTELLDEVRLQVERAIEQADLILFVVDGRRGITALDDEVAQALRRFNRKMLLVVNKIDNPEQLDDVYEFYNFGFGEPMAVSAEHGKGTGDLLDLVVETIDAPNRDEIATEAIKVAIVGKPNVGKSSLVNKLLGEDRVIVADMPGTTRDAIDIYWRHDDQGYILIDTAGMRRKAKVKENVEYYSVKRGLDAVDRSDVSILVVDAEELITEQDKKIAGYIHEAGKASIVLVNKWDLPEKETNTMQEYTESILEQLAFMSYVPVVFASAKTGQRLAKLPEKIKEVESNWRKRVPTGVLNRIISDAMAIHTPRAEKGRKLRVYYVTQTSAAPPTFVFFVNDSKLLHYSYERYLENIIRETFDFEGTPIRLVFKNKRGEDE